MVRRNVLIPIGCAVLVSLGATSIGTVGPGAAGVTLALAARSRATALPANSLLNSDWENPNPDMYPTYTRVDNTGAGFVEHADLLLDRLLVVNTKITDVKFCNGTVGLTETLPGATDPTKAEFWTANPNGISDVIPAPLSKELNHVKWHEFNMLISGIGFAGYSEQFVACPYYHTAYGPIEITQDGTNINHMYDSTGNHPRKNLGYLPVTVMYPQRNWNGHLIFYAHGQDLSVGAATSLYVPTIDFQYMLKRGYAICTYQNCGMVPLEQNVNAHDNRYAAAIVLGYIGGTTRYFIYPIRVMEDGSELPATSTTNSTYPLQQRRALHDDETLVRNIVHLAKNLLYSQLGLRPEKTYFAGWSRSGGPAGGVNCGRSCVTSTVYQRGGFTPRTGGNFVKPYIPNSGLVFDGFFARSPFIFTGLWNPDNEFPMTAPYVTVIGSGDSPGLFIAPTAVVLKKVQQGFASILQPDNMNEWMRIYQPYLGNHIPRTQFLDTAFDGGAVYYDPSGASTLERFNREGRGWRLNWMRSNIIRSAMDLYADHYGPNVMASIERSLLAYAYGPLEAGHVHQSLFNLMDWVEKDISPPVSRLDEYIMAYPTKPLPGFPEKKDVLGRNGDVNRIKIDCVEPVCSGCATKWTMGTIAQLAMPYIRDILRPQGKFDYSTEALEMPDMAVRTGLFSVGVANFSVALSIPGFNRFDPFTETELLNGHAYSCVVDPTTGWVKSIDFKGYANHGEYVDQMAGYVEGLVADRLYDPFLGAKVIVDAAHAPYPTPRGPDLKEAAEDMVAIGIVHVPLESE
jgi:hypothetical protein